MIIVKTPTAAPNHHFPMRLRYSASRASASRSAASGLAGGGLSAISYPAEPTAALTAPKSATLGRYSTSASSVPTLTLAVLTPGTARSARSTAWTQLWHVRPDTGSSTRRAPATPARTPVVAEGALLAVCVDSIGCPPSVNRHAIPVAGHDDLPPELSPDPPGERFRRPRVAVHHEHALGSPGRRAQPAHEPVRVGVGGEAVNRLDVGPHRDVLPEDPHGLRPLVELWPAGADGLVADQQHRRAWIGEALPQVVEHAPSGDHPAGRDDEDRPLDLVDRARLGRTASQPEVPAVERAVPRHGHGPHVPLEVLRVGAVDLRRLNRHGAVHVRGEPRS